ncbi:hypothetical protein KIL84_011438, partial [Mauremys mutica]
YINWRALGRVFRHTAREQRRASRFPIAQTATSSNWPEGSGHLSATHPPHQGYCLAGGEANMKILVAFAVLFLISAQVFAEEIGANDDLNYWSDWSDSDQLKEELPLPLEHFLQRIARRPRPQQFYGLMGKRDAGYGQISHKRHKTDSFVGLMGKRSLNSGSSEKNTAQNYERRHK